MDGRRKIALVAAAAAVVGAAGGVAAAHPGRSRRRRPARSSTDPSPGTPPIRGRRICPSRVTCRTVRATWMGDSGETGRCAVATMGAGALERADQGGGRGRGGGVGVSGARGRRVVDRAEPVLGADRRVGRRSARGPDRRRGRPGRRRGAGPCVACHRRPDRRDPTRGFGGPGGRRVQRGTRGGTVAPCGVGGRGTQPRAGRIRRRELRSVADRARCHRGGRTGDGHRRSGTGSRSSRRYAGSVRCCSRVHRWWSCSPWPAPTCWWVSRCGRWSPCADACPRSAAATWGDVSQCRRPGTKWHSSPTR